MMPWLFESTMSNALIATALALGVAAVARWLRHRPAAAHAMWLIVLLKLVTPPLVKVPVKFPNQTCLGSALAPTDAGVLFSARVPMRPGTGDVPSGTAGESHTQADVTEMVARLERIRGARLWPSTSASWFLLAVLVVWFAGTVVWTVYAAVRIVQFSRLLRAARPCARKVAAMGTRAAQRLGLRKAPAIVIVDARVSPLVWPAGRRTRIVLPGDLVSKCNNEQLRLLLAHELAHVKRGDHLVRWFTLVVLAVYWWHPVAWWVVRRLRAAEEHCCDAMVVAASPHRARAYAEMLLKTMEFLAARPSPPQVLASGISSGGSSKRRCEMILEGRTKSRTSRIARVLLLLAALAVLPLATVLRADDKSSPKCPDERPRRLGQEVERCVAGRQIKHASTFVPLHLVNERPGDAPAGFSRAPARFNPYFLKKFAVSPDRQARIENEIQLLQRAGFSDELIYTLFKDRANVETSIQALKKLLEIVDEDE
jgi:bla regulator protein BlaR1